jgi:hypothetical protein
LRVLKVRRTKGGDLVVLAVETSSSSPSHQHISTFHNEIPDHRIDMSGSKYKDIAMRPFRTDGKSETATAVTQSGEDVPTYEDGRVYDVDGAPKDNIDGLKRHLTNRQVQLIAVSEECFFISLTELQRGGNVGSRG